MTPKSPDLAPIGSLWIDGAISWLEIASLQSFVDLGHDVVLYTYGDVPNAPKGVTVRDAREVWENEDILVYKSANSPALHADIFRVKMVLVTGRVWVDTDVIALKPFLKSAEWFIGHEREDKLELGNAVFGMPQTSKLLGKLDDLFSAPQPVPPWMNRKQRDEITRRWQEEPGFGIGDLPWGTFGPKAVTQFAIATEEIGHAAPQSAFFPVAFNDRKVLVDPSQAEDLDARMAEAGSYSVHLYSRWLRKVASRSDIGLPDRNSWIGRWAAGRGIVDYPSPVRAPAATEATPDDAPPQDPAAVKAAREEARRIEAEVAAASAAALSDLEARKARIPGGPNLSRHGNVRIVTMAKDEGPYVLEWVAHHHVLGFTDILAYTNDCTDGTDEMFDALAACGLCTRLDNPQWRDKPPQSRALHWAEQNPLVIGADWLLVMDLDEFVTVKGGDHRIDGLIDEVLGRDATGLCLTWRFFGSAGARDFEAGPVTERLTQAAPDDFVKGSGIKTLFKTDPHLALAIHRPYLNMRFARSEEGKAYPVAWVNGDGEAIDGKNLKWRLNIREIGYGLAQMNHYGVKSREEYMLRRLRGDVLDNHSKYDEGYFGLFDRNEIEDRSALLLKARRDALIADLLTVPAVRAAADLVEKRRQAKLARLRASDGFEAAMDRLEPLPIDVAMKVKRK
ncbi:glycosyltransferase family 2 protein [Falsirhodobacter halotolerans]|uniref:glycosyltransferase family 2 protein n=1 Tax=Falsirhodobacter halotolerans TaxID=1146892 RepID=UPI001FD12967|nr:glycosyltransferase family 2 protein [Falsirhodobacter halotolerans]MCJ8138982.1 glycosyltransferase family 2 protein [Falsirhodobacter halotolerans]